MTPTLQDLVPHPTVRTSPEVERLATLVRATLAASLESGMDRLAATRRTVDALHRECPNLSDSAALAAVWRFRELGDPR